jgi:hypothetical protein
MSTPHGSRGSGISGFKIPKRLLIIVSSVVLGLFITQGITPAFEVPEKGAFLLSLGVALASGIIAVRMTAHRHHHVGGTHSHGHGTPWWKLGLAILAMVYVTLQVWWFAESHWGRSADKIKEVRAEERKRLERLVDAVDEETGIFTGKRYTRVAPVVDLNSVPRTNTLSVPSGFSDPIPLPPHAEWNSDTEGRTGPYLLWDGSKIWLCEEGLDNQITNVTWLAFASVTNYPLRMTVTVRPKPYTY